MRQKNRILLIDDSPNELKILLEILKSEFSVVATTSAEDGIKMVSEDTDIQLVVVDAMMPGLDGFDACRQILEIKENSIPVVFISANTRTEEVLKAFDAGASDFLSKPFEPELIRRKLELTLRDQVIINRLRAEKNEATEMVFTAINSASQIGTVLNFLRSALHCRTPEELSSELLKTAGELGLELCVELRGHSKTCIESTTGAYTQLEKELLSRSASLQQRFLEKGSRYIINYDTVAVIIKNIPVDNPARAGELRDSVMMLLDDVNILNQNLISNQGVSTFDAKTELKPDVESKIRRAYIVNEQARIALNTQVVYEDLLEDIFEGLDARLEGLDLLETQEEAVRELIREKVIQAAQHPSTDEVAVKLDTLRDLLS